MRALATTLAIALSAVTLGPAGPSGWGAQGTDGADFSKRRIQGHVRERVVGSSWRRGCPVPLRKLRLLRVTYRDFDGQTRKGSLIVHREESSQILGVMRRLYRDDFPIRRIHLIDRYGADNHRSMDADNTSAFNCRFVAGTSRWSMHAYGRAIDINPRENPYVTPSGHVSPPAGKPFADRSRHAKGMIHHGDETWDAFRDAGWEWGGDWSGTRDFQHFSSNGS